MHNIFNTLDYIEIETISSCTRACPWCLFGQHKGFRPKTPQILETSIIKDILEDLRKNGFKGSIGLFSINEPLMDNRIISGQLVSLCKKVLGDEVSVGLTTNGDLIDSSIVDTLFSCGLDYLKISCYNSEQYNNMLKLTTVCSQHIEVLDQTRYLTGKYESNRGGAISGSYRKNKMYTSCLYPYYRSSIGWNGNVRVCYNNILEDIVLGNVKERSYSEIMNDDYSETIRQSIMNQRQSVFPCSVCNVKGIKTEEEHFE